MNVRVSIDVVELVLAVEAAKKGASEQPPASNAGPYVERVQRVTGNKKGDAWCASDVADTGSIAFAAAKLHWPLPLTGGCQQLADYFDKRHALYEKPQRGDLWLRWHAELGRFGHVGFVLTVMAGSQIEVQAGNTIISGDKGSTREGWLNWTRVETYSSHDRFGRWVDLVQLPGA